MFHSIRIVIFPALFALAFLILSGCKQPTGDTTDRRPNILFIPVDDLRTDLGAYGNTHILTPNIDRLAEDGMVFTRTYCQQAVCNPSRASLLTGLSPDSLRVWDLRTKFRDNVPDAITLPQYFKENGYTTIGIGKIYHNTIPDTLSWTEKPHIDGYPFDPDAVYRKEENVRRVEEKILEYKERGIDRVDQLGHWYVKTVATEIAEVDDDAYFDGAQTTLAIKKLQELSESTDPFFLAVGYYRPHLPFNAPKKYWDLYDRDSIPLATNPFFPQQAPDFAMNTGRELRGYEDFRDLPLPEDGTLSEDRQRLLKHGYYASVSYIDAQVGRLLDALEELGLKDNTIIVLWGDHGWKLGEHNSWCKQTNYEIDTRVPMIFAGPGVESRGSQTPAITEFLDIYPTLCDLAGLEIPPYLHGKSLRPLFKDPDAVWENRAFSQFLQGRFGKPRPGYEGVEIMGYALRTDRYRYVEWYAWDRQLNVRKELMGRELYDHVQDPSENTNVAEVASNKQRVDSLSHLLRRHWR